MNRRIKYFILLCCSIALASIERIDTSIEAGDTLNKVLRRHHVKQSNIHTINKKQFHELNTISPYDRISLVIDSESNTLLSCHVFKTKNAFVLDKMQDGYTISETKQRPDEKIVSLHTQTVYPPESKLIKYVRMIKSIDHTFHGSADILFKDQQISTLKLYYPNRVLVASVVFDDNHQGYTLHGQNTLHPFFSRTPTNYKRISSHFDPQRLHPVLNEIRPHLGVDLAGPINTPIWAAASGIVTHKSTDSSFGNYLVISHPFGATTHYAHMNKFHQNIQVGDEVDAFETIGYIGSTGRSTGPHLHFEFRINGEALDPLVAKIPHISNNTASHIKHV
ncbi:M23 family metallopeptidase [Gammaproteobacteria bacterium]|nr:M23 family metallopeptidase [Gammaproteobacteria bacterium]